MINFDNENKMYDLFIDNEVLATQELLDIGFTNKDLTRLVESGKLKRVKRGVYELGNADGLFNYCKILFSKKYKNYERAVNGLKRCAEIEPNNGWVHTRLFLNSIMERDYEQAVKSFEIMVQTDNEYYKRDLNVWLFLLNNLAELTEEQKNRLNNMCVEDMFVCPDDYRYNDKFLQNRIRSAIYNKYYEEALDLIKRLVPERERKINIVITEKLLCKVVSKTENMHNMLYNHIVNGDYEEAKKLLIQNQQFGLNRVDEQFLIVISDLIEILNSRNIPVVDRTKSISTFGAALAAHDYKKAFELYQTDASKSSKFMDILLKRVETEINKLEADNSNSHENTELFASIVTNLLNQDVEKAFTLLEEYLKLINKSNFRGYVADLIKLSIIKNDVSFEEPVLLLSVLSRDQFDFNVSLYIQDFYFSVARKKFKEAAIYLDILSMSGKIGGLLIPTDHLKNKLIEEAAREGISKEDLGINDEPISALAEVELKAVAADDEATDNLEVVEDLIELPFDIAHTFEDVLNGDNIVMLEPMTDDEISKVVEAASKFPKIQVKTIAEATGEKRVVLRYYDKVAPYINIGATLKEADRRYKSWEYEGAIALYESVLPKLENPRSFIFARLGNCYRLVTCGGDYSKAIDYYTLAMVQSREEDNTLDFSDVINKLKTKCNYNGRKVGAFKQYKKESK